jgi:hypothetical protein
LELAFFLPCFPFFTEFTGYQLSSQYLVSHLRPSVLAGRLAQVYPLVTKSSKMRYSSKQDR